MDPGDAPTAGYWDSQPCQPELEFPGTTALVPDVSGKRVLDTGCGNGVSTDRVLDRGAAVVGVDGSEEMFEQAAKRFGDRAAFHRADLETGFRLEEIDAPRPTEAFAEKQSEAAYEELSKNPHFRSVRAAKQ